MSVSWTGFLSILNQYRSSHNLKNLHIGNWDANVQKNDKTAAAICKFRENFANIKNKIADFKNLLYLYTIS